MHRRLRSLLILGRVSNLPTVWSNCLAGWTLAGGPLDASASLLLLCAGCSLLYTAGMYLNDVCDVKFDTTYRPERPIPSGVISRFTATLLGALMLITGLAALLWLAPQAAVWGVALAGLIVLYDLLHKRVSFGPELMASCRMLIYPVAGAAAAHQTGTAPSPEANLLLWWAAVSMGVWILTLTLLARTEAKPGPFHKLILILLAIPIYIGMGTHGLGAVIAMPLLTIWMIRCVLRLQSNGRIGAAVGDLLAGIPLVDLLSVSPPMGVAYLPYLGCMLLALILRRSIPPT